MKVGELIDVLVEKQEQNINQKKDEE